MKKGKSIKLTGYKSFKVSYGTVDFKNLKSVYLNIQSWVEPKDFIENAEKIINHLTRTIKLTIGDLIDRNLFESNFICDMDLRSSGVMFGKKSFMNLECVFYTTKHYDFKCLELKNHMKKITDSVIKYCLKNNKHFNFSISKKEDFEVIRN
jgi:hypothetical protein